ncbi:unnamed protein product, partial [Allacma fusca]
LSKCTHIKIERLFFLAQAFETFVEEGLSRKYRIPDRIGQLRMMIITVVMLLACRIFWLDSSGLMVGAAAGEGEILEDYSYLSSSPEPDVNSLEYSSNGINDVVMDETESNDLPTDNITDRSLAQSNESMEDDSPFSNQSGGEGNNSSLNEPGRKKEYPIRRDPLIVVIPVTLIFSLILLIGLIGNVSTCVVIAKNSYMHTATNYYLFSLAVSDLLLLISGLPQEMYLIWIKGPYIFGEAFCLIRGLAAETSANATVLTITSFTVERYVAICHPLRSHKLSQLSRVITIILLIWVFALVFALPQAAQFGVTDEVDDNGRVLIEGAWCSIKRHFIPYAFQISICVFFVIPMTMITVLYVLIGLKLRRSPGSNRNNREITVEPRNTNRHSQSHVIRMLIAVVVAFFICWAPFHIQRLMAIYSEFLGLAESDSLSTLYKIINYVSGILYYVSTCINPILYHIMSNKFRQAFKDTISQLFGRPTSQIQHTSYSSIFHNRSSRMGVHHHLHHQYHHYGSRRGAHQETCINCRHSPTMCSCRGNSQKYVRTYNLDQTASDKTTVSLLSTTPSEKDPVIAVASLDTRSVPFYKQSQKPQRNFFL